MSHYRSNLRDIEFNLFEVFDREAIIGTAPFDEIGLDDARAILVEMSRLAEEDLAASYEDSDRNPPVFDPATSSAPLPESFKKSFAAWQASGFWRLNLPSSIGGTPAPSSLYWAIGEMVLGSNAPIWMYGGGPFFAGILEANGNDRDKRLARLIMDKGWVATMVLTEPDAGSDVGAGRTRALPNADGSWNIEGVKRFITSAESDLSDQIIHFVLARPVGVDGVGGPGTKGLSLFIVPKFHWDFATGELGERNGVYVTNVERKMGLKVSNTCELTFGQNSPAVGYLLGEVHEGIAQMFQVIENARMMVGTKAIATLSTGYLNALDHAKNHLQGADPTVSTDEGATPARLIEHPDVRRSLMTQKSATEAMRALVLYTATWQDQIAVQQHQGDRGEAYELARAVNDLLLPIVKGYGSERSWVLLGTESLPTFGRSGCLQDHPLEQYVRDAKIDTLYEGTTAIQGQDFFFRKIVKDQGRAVGHLFSEIQVFLQDGGGASGLEYERRLLTTAVDEVSALVAHMVEDLMSAQDQITNVYKVGLNTSRLLMALGDVVCSWLLLRQADVASARLTRGNDLVASDTAFYEGKVAAARFFARQRLPGLGAELAIAKSVDLSVMNLSEDAL